MGLKYTNTVVLITALFGWFVGTALATEMAMVVYPSQTFSISEARDRGIAIEIDDEAVISRIEVRLNDDFQCDLAEVTFLVLTETNSPIVSGEIPTRSRSFIFELHKKYLNGFSVQFRCSAKEQPFFSFYEVDFGK